MSFYQIIITFYQIIILIYQINYSDISKYYCVLSNYYFDNYSDILTYCIFIKLLFRFCNGTKFSDKQVWANSVDPDQILEEQSDQGLHCLPFPVHLLDLLLYGRATSFKLWRIKANFLGLRKYRNFTVYQNIISIYRNNYSDISTYYCVLSNYYFDISK